MGESFEEYDEQDEKQRIQKSLLKTIEILQKKIDKQKMLVKVKDDKIRILQNKLNESK